MERSVDDVSPFFAFADASCEALDNDRVVQADVERTRGHLAFFRERSSTLAVAITQYCNVTHLSYHQGFNEVLAPFLVIEEEDPLQRLVMFHSFFATFVRPVYLGTGFHNLQNVLALIDTLLLYHCPKLAVMLTLAGLEPVCYCTPWLLTMFASKLDVPSVCYLWDKIIDRNDRTFAAYLCVAILWRAELMLINTEFSSLPESLSALTPSPIDDVWEKAVQLQLRSPSRFGRFIGEIFANDDVIGPPPPSGQPKLTMSMALRWKEDNATLGPVLLQAQEVLLEELYGGRVIIDSRPRAEFDGHSGRLPKAIWVDSVTHAIDMIKGSTCHFCILDPIMAAECAIDAHCAQVCSVVGGYAALHNLALKEDLELVDHDEKFCMICRPEWMQKAGRTAEKATKWISATRSFKAVKNLASTTAATVTRLSINSTSPQNIVIKQDERITLPIDNQIGIWSASMERRHKKQDVPCAVVLSEDTIYIVAVGSGHSDSQVILAGPFRLRDIVRITKRVRTHDCNRVFYFRDVDRKEYCGFALNFALTAQAQDFTTICQCTAMEIRRKTKRVPKNEKCQSDR